MNLSSEFRDLERPRRALSPWLEVMMLLFAGWALLSHLGFTPLQTNTDEARRALVSAEMIFSGDYIVPTINGEIYLNKPPFYNWIVITSFRLFGNFSMFAFRLPVILSALVFAFIIFQFVKKHSNRNIAFITALAFITNGRFFLYDSLQGLIDTTFSMLIFLNFMLIYHLGKRGSYFLMFILTYLITAACFLMKGLPALLFQGFSLLVFFMLEKKFSRLISLAHFTGLIALLAAAGIYYFFYFNSTDLSPSLMFGNIMEESSKRTGIKFGIWDTLLHLFTFPFELIYHFLPWTVLVLALIRKDVLEKLRGNSFLWYLTWIFIINIIPYWISVEVFARYLLMFVPLIYYILLHFYFRSANESGWQFRTLNIILTFSIAISALFIGVLFFINHDKIDRINNFNIRNAIIFLLLVSCVWLAIKRKDLVLYAFALSIITLRIGFNWYIVEQRSRQHFETRAKAERIIQISGSRPVFLLTNVQAGNSDALSFHISVAKKRVLQYDTGNDTSAYYIADSKQLRKRTHISYFKFTNYLSDTLQLVKFRDRANVSTP